MALQRDMGEGGDAEADGRRIEQRGMAGDDADLGKALQAAADLRGREMHHLAQRGMGGEAVGLGVTAFAQVVLERHGKAQSDAFERAVGDLPQVLECHSVSGDADYLLRIVAPDLPAFSELMMKQVLRLPGVAQVKTLIALQKLKQSHVLPLEHLTLPARTRRQVRYAGSAT